MDEEFYTIPPTSLPHGNQPNFTEFLHTNTVSIFVDSEWNGGNTSLEGVIQHCPAIYIPTPSQIPQAVKHIYSRLAASADSLDHGVPELILSLVGTGNSFSFENSERLINGLGKLFGRCSLWVITSGEHSDPLAYAASKALRSALLHRDNPEETLMIGINSADIHNISTKDPNFPLITRKEPPHMVDARLNTLYLVWGKNNPTERNMMLFRACTAIKLAIPPPALLIGVPEERTSISGSFSHSQTPISTQNSPATILLSSSLSNEKKPLNLVVFCGVTLSSLLELVIYAQCGVPSLVVQDISELCVVLKSAFSLFQSAVFEHNAFEFWLERELRMVALATAGRYVESEIIEAKKYVLQLLLTISTSEHSLLAFLPANNLDKIGEEALDLLIRSAADVNEWASPLELSCKLGVSRPLNFICLEGHFTEKQFSSFLFVVLNLPEKERVNVLSSLLKQNIPLPVNSEFLIKWAVEAEERHFFNTIVLGQLLSLQNLEQLTHIDENIASKFDNLLTELSGGLYTEIPFRIFTFWSLFLLQTEDVLIFCSFSNEPIALSLILSKISKELAKKCNQWILYKNKLKKLSFKLINFAVKLIDCAYSKNQNKAYNALCRPLPSVYKRLTLIQLAFETNAKVFISHECCQQWIQQLLYGQIQIQTISNRYIIPDWIKILLSSLFVFPSIFWIRPINQYFTKLSSANKLLISPTVALLEDGRHPRNVRSSSANSIHSIRSAQFGGVISGREGEDRRSSPGVLIPVDTVNIGNEGIDENDQINQISTNDNSTVTDSFLPSASQLRSIEIRKPRNELPSTGQRQKPGDGLGSRRPSPDRRSLMFCDGGGSGSLSERSRRQSRSSRLLLGSNSAGGAGGIDGTTSNFRLLSPQISSLFLPSIINTPKTLFLFYSTPIVKYWLSLVFRLIYLVFLCWAVAQPGCFLSGWIEQFIWLWALCWVIDSIWVYVCWSQQINWNGKRLNILIDIIITSTFLLLLLIIRLLITSSIGRKNNSSSFSSLTYELKIFWSLFMLFEFIRSLYIYLPLFKLIGQLFIKINLMFWKILLPFLMFCLLFIIISTIVLKSVLFPDLSAQPVIMGETFVWTFKQFFTTDLNIFHQSIECQRQLLPENRLYCQALGGYANPRCPSQHWLAKFSLIEFFVLLNLFCWPLLLAILISALFKLDKKEVEDIWMNQRYSLIISFSLRPCLPPPLTPIFLAILACCKFGASGNFSCYPQNGFKNNNDVNTSQNFGKRKYCTVYKNPSVQSFRYRSSGGFWRDLAINLLNELNKENKIEEIKQKTEIDKTSLLLDFSVFTQRLETEKESRWEYIKDTSRLKVNPSLRNWLRLLPHYRPNSFSLPIDQLPIDLQKHAQDASVQNLLDIGCQWRQKRLFQFLSLIDKGKSENILNDGIMLNGNGLPLNPSGRCGLAGRGNFPRFGPNRLFLYALFQRCDINDSIDNSSNNSSFSANSNDINLINVLVQMPSGRLPSRWALSPGPQIVDEFLAQLLLQLGLPDPDIHTISCKTNLLPGQRDGPIAVISGENLLSGGVMLENLWPEWPQDTDNAWTEIRIFMIVGNNYSSK
uniref:TRPM-like domain-containing protein n=1 Tax=Meloidogyne enterolobii TaxID=390850 RepID=A0A6V7XTM3_MELEN|nr:unnamed protein product [Meloidogyne enterolobii]